MWKNKKYKKQEAEHSLFSTVYERTLGKYVENSVTHMLYFSAVLNMIEGHCSF